MIINTQINNFLLKTQIGSGAYGLVFHAIDINTHYDYAIKAVIKQGHGHPTLSNNNNNNNPDDEDNINKQSSILLTQLYHYFKTFQNKLILPTIDLDSIKKLTNEQLLINVPHYKEIALHLKVQNHKNIVKIHQVLESPLATFIVMDNIPIDLFTSIVELQHFINDPLLIKKVFLQLCSALNYSHSLGVYHCDIKPENVLLDNNDNAYLCDFGLATTSKELAPNICIGSSYYMAPERILYKQNEEEEEEEKKNNTFKTASGDIWSLGIILINLTCIRNPWSKAHQVDDKTFNYFVKDPTVLKKILPITDEFFNLLIKILQINPNDRIDLKHLIYEISALTSFTKDGPLSVAPILTNELFNEFVIGTTPTNLTNNTTDDDDDDEDDDEDSDDEVEEEEEEEEEEENHHDDTTNTTTTTNNNTNERCNSNNSNSTTPYTSDVDDIIAKHHHNNNDILNWNQLDFQNNLQFLQLE